ncbi:MAG: hypothetical protein LQ344_005212 [Seirophora lacunosa]|nr:MAG: hypothetical protein LQ344_005212 [Seirophora lacunosa]
MTASSFLAEVSSTTTRNVDNGAAFTSTTLPPSPSPSPRHLTHSPSVPLTISPNPNCPYSLLPNPQTAPSVVSTTTCSSPTATSATSAPPSTSTRCTSSRCPSSLTAWRSVERRAWSFLVGGMGRQWPQIYRSFSSLTAATIQLPATIFRTGMPSSAETTPKAAASQVLEGVRP